MLEDSAYCIIPIGERSCHLGLEIRVTVQAHTVGSDLFRGITNHILVFCYESKVEWIFHEKVSAYSFSIIIVIIQIVRKIYVLFQKFAQ